MELINKCLVPRFQLGNERPCDESDFVQFVNDNVLRLENFKRTFSDLMFEKELAISVLMVLGENCQKYPWNNERVCEICCQIREKMLRSEQQLLAEGFSGSKNYSIPPLLKPVLLALRPKLLKDTWKEYPAAVECFQWILKNSRAVHIADNVHHILPAALLFVDDFVNENRVIGVQCLGLILSSLTVAELKYHGYGDLCYKALQGLLRERNVSVAENVIPCIMTLIVKLETDFGDVQPYYKWSRFDDTMEILLEIIEIESEKNLQKLYASKMTFIVETMGPRIHRWTKRILSIMESYYGFFGCDHKTILQLVTATKSFLAITRTVVKWYRLQLYSILCQLIRQRLKEPIHEEIDYILGQCLRLANFDDPLDENIANLKNNKVDIGLHDKIIKLLELNN